MNAAAKVIHQGNFFSGQLADVRLTSRFWLYVSLVFTIFISALAVVYSTNIYRTSFSQLQMAEHQAHKLEVQRGQLLLEQASLATPARVERMAKKQLNMILPTGRQIKILRIE